VERHHQAAFIAAVIDAEPEELGVRRKWVHQCRFSGCIGYAKCSGRVP